MKIKIIMDRISRELNLALRLKEIVESSQLGVVSIAHQDYVNSVDDYDFFDSLFADDFDILITPNYNVLRTPDILLRAYLKKAKLVIYHSEQFFSEKFDIEKLNLKTPKEYNSHISAHLVWGEQFARKLNVKAGIPKEKIFVVGNYKFDFLKELPRPANPNVLIVSNFNFADYTDRQVLEFGKKHNVPSITGVNTHCAQARENCLEWVREAADAFPNVMFTVRPHPGEAHDAYNNIAGGNVRLSKRTTSFAEDLECCSLVAGYTSTSAMETIAADRVYLCLDLVVEEYPFPIIHDKLLRKTTKEEFFLHLEQIASGRTLLPTEQELDSLNSLINLNCDACLAIIRAIQLVHNTNEAKPKFFFGDYVRMIRAFGVGCIKFILIKAAYALNGRFGFSSILKYSQKSFEKRVVTGELLTERLLVSEGKKVKKKAADFSYSFPTERLTDRGWVFSER